MTLFDALQALYEKYGYYGEKTHNLVMPGLDGLKKMAALMKSLRRHASRRRSPAWPWRRAQDYQDGTVADCATGAAVTAIGADRLQRAALRAG